MSKFPGNFPLHRRETVKKIPKQKPEDRERPVQVKFEDHRDNVKLAVVTIKISGYEFQNKIHLIK